MAAVPKWQLFQNGEVPKWLLFQNGSCSKNYDCSKIPAVPKWLLFQNGDCSKMAAVPELVAKEPRGVFEGLTFLLQSVQHVILVEVEGQSYLFM